MGNVVQPLRVVDLIVEMEVVEQSKSLNFETKLEDDRRMRNGTRRLRIFPRGAILSLKGMTRNTTYIWSSVDEMLCVGRKNPLVLK